MARGTPSGGSPPPGPEADPVEVARTICLRLLTAAPRTRAQLEQALRRRGAPESAIAAVLDRLTDVGLVDDAAFAGAWVDSRGSGRGLGRRALAAELRQRGVPPPVAAAALDRVSRDDEVEQARRLVRRRVAATVGLDPLARRRRLVGLLARRGYDQALAVSVVTEALAGEPGTPARAETTAGFDDGCDATLGPA